MYVYFILTDQCNCNCSFCIRNNLDTIRRGTIRLSSFNSAVALLNRTFPESTLVLTGGEPSCHPEFEQILDESLSSFRSVIVTSNGSFGSHLSSVFSNNMSKNLALQISLDGTQSVHDGIRGNGMFKKVWKNIDCLNEVSNHLIISSTIGKSQFEDCIELAKLLNQVKFHHWKVSLTQESISNIQAMTSVNEWNRFVDELLPYCQYPVHIKKMFEFNIWDNCLKTHREHLVRSRNCGIGKDKIYISPSGELFPCTCMNTSLGNIFSTNIEDIKKKLDEASCISPLKESVCWDCKYNAICNGGCPGYSFQYFGKVGMGDIRCPKIKINCLCKA